MMALVLGLVPLAACTDPGDPADASSTQTPVQSTSAGGTTMKEQIAATLESTSPTIADAVRAESTRVTPVDAAALAQWQIVDVLSRGDAHPQRWFMGVKDGGSEVVVLSGFPQRWSQVTEGARVTDAAEAEELATVHADATRDMRKGYTRVTSVDDIRFLPHPSDAESTRIESIRRDHGQRITGATATGDGPWTVTLWTVTDGDLVRHDVTVETGGGITDDSEVVAPDLPVPQAR